MGKLINKFLPGSIKVDLQSSQSFCILKTVPCDAASIGKGSLIKSFKGTLSE